MKMRENIYQKKQLDLVSKLLKQELKPSIDALNAIGAPIEVALHGLSEMSEYIFGSPITSEIENLKNNDVKVTFYFKNVEMGEMLYNVKRVEKTDNKNIDEKEDLRNFLKGLMEVLN